jgi:hypothetical protein
VKLGAVWRFQNKEVKFLVAIEEENSEGGEREGPILGGVPVPTAWRVLGLRMEERPPDMEVSCEFLE